MHGSSKLHVSLMNKFCHAAPIIGHVGDGNFHSLILLDSDDREQVGVAKELAARMARYGCSNNYNKYMY